MQTPTEQTPKPEGLRMYFFLVSLLPAVSLAAITLLVSRYGFKMEVLYQDSLGEGFRILMSVIGAAIFMAMMHNGYAYHIPLGAVMASALAGAAATFSADNFATLLVFAGLMLVLALITARFLKEKRTVTKRQLYRFIIVATLCSFIANLAVALVWQGHF